MTSFNYCDIRVFLVSLVFCWYIPQSVCIQCVYIFCFWTICSAAVLRLQLVIIGAGRCQLRDECERGEVAQLQHEVLPNGATGVDGEQKGRAKIERREREDRASRQASVSCTSSKSSHNLATRSPRPLNFCSTLLPLLSSARTRAEPQLWRNKVAAAAFDHLFFYTLCCGRGNYVAKLPLFANKLASRTQPTRLLN